MNNLIAGVTKGGKRVFLTAACFLLAAVIAYLGVCLYQQKKASELAEANRQAQADAQNATEKLTLGIEAKISENFKDPDSARFRNVQLFPNGNACGEVNAKNGFGAYIGYVAWWFIDGVTNVYPATANQDSACIFAKDPVKKEKSACEADADLLVIYKDVAPEKVKSMETSMKDKDCQRFGFGIKK